MRKYAAITIVLLCLINLSAIAQADFSIAAKPIEDAIAKSAPVLLNHDSAATVIKKDSITLPKGKTIYGIASFYSKNLEGSKTSTGEHFHHKLMTAASNNFPLNTWVRVTNLRNNKSVIVRINDHMAVRMYQKGRVVDLSHAAASQLDFIVLGVIRVKVEEVPEGTEE